MTKLAEDSLAIEISLLRQMLETALRPRLPIGPESLQQITGTRPWAVDYHERKHIYFWSPNQLTLTVEDLGSYILQPNLWQLFDMPKGARITAASSVGLFALYTDELLPYAFPVVSITGTVTTSNASVGVLEAAIPGSATLIGAVDDVGNLEELALESNAHPNLRTAIYNAANELAIDGSGNASVKTVSGSVVQANAGTNLNTSALALESGGHLASLDSHLPAQGQAAMAASVPVAIASNQSAVPENLSQINGSAPSNTNPLDTRFISQPNYVALTSPAIQTTAGTDTLFTFSSQVNTVIIQNNTGATVGVAFDATSSAGSLQLAAGQTLIYSKKVTVVHLFTAAAQNVNGTTAGNIVLLGEL